MISKVTKNLRKIYLGVIYISVVLIFIFATIYTIMIAKGYRYNFSNGLVQKTGMIVMVSRPSGADIYVNDKKISKKTGIPLLPTKLSNLDPGEYKIEVKKDKYKIWQKIIKVKEELVSWANYILLVPEKSVKKEVTKDIDIINFSMSPDKRKLFFIVKNNNFREIFVFDIQDEKNDLLLIPQLVAGTEILNFEWNSDSSRLILTTKNADKTENLALNINDETDLYLIPSEYSNISWNKSNSKELFALKNNNLYKIDITKPNTPILLSEKVISYTLSSSKIIYVTYGENQNSLVSMDLDGGNKKEIGILPYSDKYKLSYSEKLDGTAVIIGKIQSLFYIYKFGSQTITKEMGKNILNSTWSNEGKKLLYFSENSAFVYDFGEENEKEYTLFSGQKIDYLRWYFDEFHLILVSNNQFKILEFDGANTNELSLVQDGSKIEFLEDYKSFFYLSKGKDSEKSSLYLLRLDPEEEKTSDKKSFLSKLTSWFEF